MAHTAIEMIIFDPLVALFWTLLALALGFGLSFVIFYLLRVVVWCTIIFCDYCINLVIWPFVWVAWVFDPRLIAPHQADLPAEVVRVHPRRDARAQRRGVGTALPAQEGEALLSVSAAAAARLRPRARWVRALDGLFGRRVGLVGLLVRGWWIPDLPAPGRSAVANALLANLQDGARLLGGGVVQRKEGDEGRGHVYYVLELSSGDTVVVFPELLSRLQAYSCFRGRDSALVPALRARAVDWCRSSGLPVWAWPFAVPTSVALSMRVFREEECAMGLMPPTLLSEHLGH